MKKDFLVGATGFVGSNLALKHRFNGLFHSKNIQEAYGQKPDLLVYSGVPAEMFLANQDPQADYQRMIDAMENIEKIAPKKVVLISTIAVYPDTHGVNEDTEIEREGQSAYGANRYALEKWVEEHCEEHLILRLPAIYGINLKKNFLYDYIHRIPSMLNEAKFQELTEKDASLKGYYRRQDNGFYKCRSLEADEKEVLKGIFETLGFSALNFTDSRSSYQFYSLENLWGHIETALTHSINRLNLATPPISVAEVYQALSGEVFHNELPKPPFDYDMRTKYAHLFGGTGGYLIRKEEELEEIRIFVQAAEKRGGV